MAWRFGDILLWCAVGFAVAQLFMVFLLRFSEAPKALLVALVMVSVGVGARFAAERLGF